MGNRGLTRVEVIVVTFAGALFLLLAIWFDLHNPTFEARKVSCEENLRQIGKAMAYYRPNYDEFFPFAWGPASGPVGPEVPGAQAWTTAPGATTLLATMCDPGTSLGCLYPLYINTPRVFRCPSTEDQPSFVVNMPFGVTTVNASGTLPQLEPLSLWSQRNWTLTSNLPVSFTNATVRASSYGYDPRISPRAAGNMVVMADWDGKWYSWSDTADSNHNGGQNVLFVDGSVKWQETNNCSNDPIDNIFIEGGIDAQGKRVYWNADTDSFLVNGAVALTLSYDGYPTLQK